MMLARRLTSRPRPALHSLTASLTATTTMPPSPNIVIIGCVHSLTHALTNPLDHSITQSPNHSITQSLNHSITHNSLTHSLTNPLLHSLSPNHLLTHSLTHSLVGMIMAGVERRVWRRPWRRAVACPLAGACWCWRRWPGWGATPPRRLLGE